MRKESGIVLGGKDRRPRLLGRWGRRLKIALLVVSLASCAGLSVSTIDEEMRVSQAELDVSRLGHAARLFRADFGRCPTGIDELAAPPEGRPPYAAAGKDPWDRAYRLSCPAPRDPEQVEVVSGGPDGEATMGDNISSL